MPVFIMLTRLSHGTLNSPDSLEKLDLQVSERIFAQCPDVEWIGNYAVLGPNDYVDIFRAPDIETATKVSTIVRTYGHADTEVWPATEWKRFKAMIRDMPGKAA